MKNLVLSSILILFIILLSCGKSTNKYLVNKELDYPIYHHLWLQQDSIEFDIGISDIVRRTFENRKLISVDSCLLCFDAFISYDTIMLFYENPDCFINFRIHNGQYTTQISYVTDIMGVYPDGDPKYNGTSMTAELRYNKLIINRIRFLQGDTIKGYFELETKPYRRYKDYQIDKIAGPFIARVKSIKTKEPYIIP